MDFNRWKLFYLALRLIHEFNDSVLSVILLSQSSNLNTNINNNNNIHETILYLLNIKCQALF